VEKHIDVRVAIDQYVELFACDRLRDRDGDGLVVEPGDQIVEYFVEVGIGGIAP